MSSSILTIMNEYSNASNTHKYLTRRGGANKSKALGFFHWYMDTDKHHTRDMISDFREMEMLAWKKTGKGLKQGVTFGEYFGQFYCVMNEL